MSTIVVSHRPPHDPEEPCAERAEPAITGAAGPHLAEGFTREVFCLFAGTYTRADIAVRGWQVSLAELGETVGIAAPSK